MLKCYFREEKVLSPAFDVFGHGFDYAVTMTTCVVIACVTLGFKWNSKHSTVTFRKHVLFNKYMEI